MSILNHFFDYKPEVLALDEKAMELCQPYFRQMEEIRDFNQLKMLKAFADTQMSSTDMLGTTGYGLWDTGRAKLEQIFAQVMGAEDALVRSQFQSGTHTLAVALFGLLRAGDILLAATGRPYDTLEGVIGLDGKGKGTGTLMDYGIRYDEAPLKADFTPNYDLIAQKAPGAKVCHIQRSRGYLQRNAFDLETIRKIADTARAANPDIIIFVDNCYGEFTQTQEPCQMGADLVVGSLIKNPGGGIAPTGGYIAGRKDLVELCAYRLNAPGLGKDLGCTLETPRDMYLGFYYAPGVVCEAIKTAIYAQCMLELLGKNPVPRYCDDHNDIVTCFDAGTADALIGFCQGIQAASPVDSYAAPEPSPEPGYTDEVVMASGSFTQGSTIELSCDGPLREPYTCYLQGGLNFAASRAGVLLAIQYDAFVVTDEVYEHIIYAPAEHICMASLPGMFEHTITCNSLSKTYSITGWRLGYLIGPAEVIEGARKVHDFLTVGAAAPLQEAAVAGLEMPASYYEKLQALYTEKRDHFLAGLDRVGLKHNVPQGTYFVMIDISDFLALPQFKGWTDLQFCEWMIREVGVSAVPGSSFFREPVNHLIRMHFARGTDVLDEAVRRLEKLQAFLK